MWTIWHHPFQYFQTLNMYVVSNRIKFGNQHYYQNFPLLVLSLFFFLLFSDQNHTERFYHSRVLGKVDADHKVGGHNACCVSRPQSRQRGAHGAHRLLYWWVLNNIKLVKFQFGFEVRLKIHLTKKIKNSSFIKLCVLYCIIGLRSGVKAAKVARPVCWSILLAQVLEMMIEWGTTWREYLTIVRATQMSNLHLYLKYNNFQPLFIFF